MKGTALTIIEGGEGWSCLDEASESLVSDMKPGTYFLVEPQAESKGHLCPKCHSTRIAFRRGDWMQCESCGYGAVERRFIHD